MLCSQACPNAWTAIITNPVNSTVAVAAEVFKAQGCYDPKKLFGVTTLDVVRSQTFIGEIAGVDPMTVRDSRRALLHPYKRNSVVHRPRSASVTSTRFCGQYLLSYPLTRLGWSCGGAQACWAAATKPQAGLQMCQDTL